MLSSGLANRLGVTAAGALAAIGCDPAVAEDRRFDAGLRGVVIVGDGEPSNDMIGYGVVGRWELRESWHLGVALDSVTFDYETPYRILGIDSVEEIDPGNEFRRASVFIERRYQRPESAWTWFWTAGVGFASIDVGENAVGTTPGGESFDIATTADDEWHFMVGGGVRRSFGRHWALEAAVTLEHHTTDYQLVDVVSGATGSIGSQTPYGLSLGVSYGF
jgi:hypothetical protein